MLQHFVYLFHSSEQQSYEVKKTLLKFILNRNFKGGPGVSPRETYHINSVTL